jgi:hypothetical protein
MLYSVDPLRMLAGYDADATEMAVFVDLDKWSVKVVDNGSGISSESMELLAFRNRIHFFRAASSI